MTDVSYVAAADAVTITRDGKGWIDQPGSLLALLNVGLGLSLLYGAPERTSSPAFRVAKAVMPIPGWAFLFIAAGVICAIAARHGRWAAATVGLGAGIHGFWAATLGQSAHQDKHVAFTGVVVYGWLALLHLTTAVRLARRAH